MKIVNHRLWKMVIAIGMDVGAVVGYINYCHPCQAKRAGKREIGRHFLKLFEGILKLIDLSP